MKLRKVYFLVATVSLAALAACGSKSGKDTMKPVKISRAVQSANDTFLRYCEPMALGRSKGDTEQLLLTDGYAKVGEEGGLVPVEISMPTPNPTIAIVGKTVSYRKPGTRGSKETVVLGYSSSNYDGKRAVNSSCMISTQMAPEVYTEDSYNQYRAQLFDVLQKDAARFQQKSGWAQKTNMPGLLRFSPTSASTPANMGATYTVPNMERLSLFVQRQVTSSAN